VKKIGREVCMIKSGEHNPRNGEGSFIRLKDGGVMLAFTEYYGESGSDDAVARLAAIVSYDEGETWSDRFLLLEKDKGARNNMSVSLLRMKNGDLGMCYLRKAEAGGDTITCMPVFRRSADEGKTWSEFIYCTDEEGYYCPFNGTAVTLKSGRIVYPVSYNCGRYNIKTWQPEDLPECGTYVALLYSDDDGKTWNRLEHIFTSPYRDSIGLAEPGLYEHENGELWVWFRTCYGFQYHSRSADGGRTWTPVMPNFFFSSPDSPMQVRRACGMTAAVFNPVPYHTGITGREEWGSAKRTPLVCAVSQSDGLDYAGLHLRSANGALRDLEKQVYCIEDDPDNSYCYPAIFDCGEYMLVSYYHSFGTPRCLNCTKVVKILRSELTGE